ALRIDLVDLPLAVLRDPQRAFGPCESRGSARRRDRREHAPALRVDLPDRFRGDLEEVAAVEGGPGLRGDVDRADGPAARGIERAHALAVGEPDVRPVER